MGRITSICGVVNRMHSDKPSLLIPVAVLLLSHVWDAIPTIAVSQHTIWMHFMIHPTVPVTIDSIVLNVNEVNVLVETMRAKSACPIKTDRVGMGWKFKTVATLVGCTLPPCRTTHPKRKTRSIHSMPPHLPFPSRLDVKPVSGGCFKHNSRLALWG